MAEASCWYLNEAAHLSSSDTDAATLWLTSIIACQQVPAGALQSSYFFLWSFIHIFWYYLSSTYLLWSGKTVWESAAIIHTCQIWFTIGNTPFSLSLSLSRISFLRSHTHTHTHTHTSKLLWLLGVEAVFDPPWLVLLTKQCSCWVCCHVSMLCSALLCMHTHTHKSCFFESTYIGNLHNFYTAAQTLVQTRTRPVECKYLCVAAGLS